MVDRSKSLRESLIKSGLLSEDQIKIAIEEGRKTGETLIKSILKKSLVEEDTLIAFLEKEMDFPRVDLSSYLVDKKIVNLVPYATARKYKMMPLFKVGDVLTVAMVDPFDILALDEVRTKSKCDVEPMVATSKDIEQAINQYYGVAGSVETLIKSIGPVEEELAPTVPMGAPVEEAPIAKLVNILILRAVLERASDVHMEPTAENVRIRYRVDGLMHDVSTAPLYLHSAIATRIKVLAKMDIAESRVPQDGRFELKTEEKDIDIRVSSYPSIYGESLVMRLLDKGSVLFGLDQLGFSKNNLEKFEESIKRPYGIILVTGPTGSGKTTTLYATLNHIVTPEKNIMTIEDPVEYELPGIRQSQINPKAGLEFANALRSIVRQDPDVILVGEIRDLETGRVAIQAALTGHLVFSTLHTNDAVGTLTRLVDMGIEPFLTASSVAAAIAQRLVRTICSRCKIPFTPPKEVLEKVALDTGKEYTFYQGKGCKNCRGTGYKGRTGIFEILLVDDKIRELILKKAPAIEIKQAAVQAGMKTLRDDGILKVIEGITSLDEVMRVTQLD
ncbi:type II secretion system protein E [candidate division WOR-1 bacterium DG_54_3]|uniref:Type II secretion system protein E n=1 Tax=candidate division WOR-1 bacterium DG_54_3 TaxID=1703775 RepID=A0A0S7Y5I3_UNCSA|nr:MAG: type II secretion system protein E [candidate division WOR-1 bacterium DG_54_3]